MKKCCIFAPQLENKSMFNSKLGEEGGCYTYLYNKEMMDIWWKNLVGK